MNDSDELQENFLVEMRLAGAGLKMPTMLVVLEGCQAIEQERVSGVKLGINCFSGYNLDYQYSSCS